VIFTPPLSGSNTHAPLGIVEPLVDIVRQTQILAPQRQESSLTSASGFSQTRIDFPQQFIIYDFTKAILIHNAIDKFLMV